MDIKRYVLISRDHPHGYVIKESPDGAFCYYEGVDKVILAYHNSAIRQDRIIDEKDKEIADLKREFARGFRKGVESVYRKNQSGCCCRFDENEEIVSVCDAHKERDEQKDKQIASLRQRAEKAEDVLREIKVNWQSTALNLREIALGYFKEASHESNS